MTPSSLTPTPSSPLEACTPICISQLELDPKYGRRCITPIYRRSKHAPFTPTMVTTLCQAVTSTGVLHTLHRKRSPHSNISPLFVLHDAGPLSCSHVIDQIITAIAKNFNDTLFSLCNIIWDCNINSSSIALVATPKGHPPRRHATKKKHEHDERDP
jgi:hypothetical protein